ncbi:MAG: nitroreductase [Alphaproteobacteria bacterium]|nr:MAG: nitroreductase [Alphaproteobacteria bacterium]
MNVSEAVETRRSIRAFLPDPVPEEVLRRVFVKAARAPSGGNLQPWHVWLLSGAGMARFRAMMAPRIARGLTDAPEYAVYPDRLWEPYRSRRFAVGEAMYARLGIPRGDRAARLRWFARNYDFFGAPAGMFLFVDRGMGAPQWSDLGGYLQTAMLLLREEGLDSCPQEAWYLQHATVSAFLDAPPELMLFCGMAIGRRDPEAAVNGLQAPRAPAEEWLRTVFE